MGVLSDLVVAPEGEAERILQSAVPSKEFGGIDIKGIDTVKFTVLHSILTGRTFEELSPAYEPVAMESDDGPWVFRIPTDLVSRLAGLSVDEIHKLAKQWAGTEEFTFDRWAESEVDKILTSISELARKAIGTGQVLFLWMSL